MARTKATARLYPLPLAPRLPQRRPRVDRTRIVATGKKIEYGDEKRPSIKVSDLRKVLGTNVHSTVRAQKNGVNEYPQPSARERGLFNFKETCPVRHTKQDDDAVLLFKGFCATKEQFESAEFKESLIPNSERFVERFVFPQDWYQDRVGFRLAASPNRAANYARILSESLVKSYLAVYEVKNASTLMRGEDFDSQWFDYLGIGEDVFLAACTTNVRLVGAYELFFPKEFF